MSKIRTIITQDGEVDDQNSLRHFLFYANEVELLGIIQTSSKFHWIGVEGAETDERVINTDFVSSSKKAPYDKPYRWTGVDWMNKTIDDYEIDYPYLSKVDPNYPTAEYLRSIIKIGNIGYEGEMEQETEGSKLIKSYILDDDPRELYIQVWGGTNTIAKALKDIEEQYINKANWLDIKKKISNKVILTACGFQDGCYQYYISESWPDIKFVKTLQMKSYAYLWLNNPEGESKDSLKSEFMVREILKDKSKLASGYRTWMDGVYYPGEKITNQFGSNPDILDVWYGNKLGMAKANKYDFLSEGDSPTFFVLLPFGFRTLEDFSLGGISGRYKQVDEVNSKGEKIKLWDVCNDNYIDEDGNECEVESMWKYVCDIQRDFASRINYVTNEHDIELAPYLEVNQGYDFVVNSGDELTLTVNTNGNLSGSIYKEISNGKADVIINDMKINVRVDGNSGDKLHLIIKAHSCGYYKLARYKHIIITIK